MPPLFYSWKGKVMFLLRRGAKRGEEEIPVLVGAFWCNLDKERGERREEKIEEW